MTRGPTCQRPWGNDDGHVALVGRGGHVGDAVRDGGWAATLGRLQQGVRGDLARPQC
jgi:hypothetical protein